MANGEPGAGIDAQGRAVRDPTDNVLDMLRLVERRQDDLREQEGRSVREVMALHSEYGAKLREAETGRIDAIRAVDVGAVQRAAETSATAASALAAQVQVSAETLRGQVAAAASAQSVALSAALDPIIKDVAELRQKMYEQAGSVAAKVETRADSRFDTGDEREKTRAVWVAAGVIGGYLTLLAGGLAALLR